MKKNEHIKGVVVIDFDGTLIKTEEPNEGKPIYKEKTGQEWPHKGWWSKPETLDLAIFPNEPYDDIAQEFKKNINSPTTWVSLVTGRMIKLTGGVHNILSHHGFNFDEVVLNGDRNYVLKGSRNDTVDFKVRYLEALKERFPNLEEIEFFDDREEHIDTFRTWGKLQTIPVNIIHVKR